MNQILEVELKPLTAIRFDGKNSKKVAKWINECGATFNGKVTKATARGSYVSINKFVSDTKLNMVKGDYAIFDPVNGGVTIYDEEQFNRNFVIKSTLEKI